MEVTQEGLEFVMTAENISWLVGILLLVISVGIQALSKKIKPWTIIFNWLGKQLNKTMDDKLDTIQKDVTELKTDIGNIKQRNQEQDEEEQEYRALQARRRIIIAADEIRNGIWHSLEWFKDVMKDISQYKQYCIDHPNFKNEEAVMSIEHIEVTWRHCNETNSFLGGPEGVGAAPRTGEGLGDDRARLS